MDKFEINDKTENKHKNYLLINNALINLDKITYILTYEKEKTAVIHFDGQRYVKLINDEYDEFMGYANSYMIISEK